MQHRNRQWSRDENRQINLGHHQRLAQRAFHAIAHTSPSTSAPGKKLAHTVTQNPKKPSIQQSNKLLLTV